MDQVTITCGEMRFLARLEAAAPQTASAFAAMLPFETQLIHARWSGEAVWLPLGDLRCDFGVEQPTSHPAPGQVLWYPGGLSETEILMPYGGCRFASIVGQLAGNHFMTIIEGAEQLPALGHRVLWGGAEDVTFALA